MMYLRYFFILGIILATVSRSLQAEGPPPEFTWHEQEIDVIDIGYGLQITDVDGDGKTDIVLADKKTIQWYEYPNWEKHVIAKNLTLRDNVCVTARDIDGDGKSEIAVGAQWNFRETLKDGAVFYLKAPADVRHPWEAIRLYNEPNTHRMHWVKGPKNVFSLVVKPLRGRGSVDGVGPGLRLMEYFMPDDPKGEWKIELINDSLHLSHNFHPVNWDDDGEEELIIAAKEGVWYLDRENGKWTSRQLTESFAGEIRDGKLPGGRRIIVTVEPMHGTKSAVYAEPEDPEKGNGLWPKLTDLSAELIDGHAIAIADYLGIGSDQVVVGWRAMRPQGTPGIKMFTPLDKDGEKWRETEISGKEVAVEDIKASDLNGDGKADIVAAGRQTRNLKIFLSAPKQR